MSTAEDRHKIYELEGALNQTSKNHLIGRDLPSTFHGFIEKLSSIGSQIDAVGLVKTRSYELGQIGIFDDGTKGIAGGKLIGGSIKSSFSTQNFKSSPSSYSVSDTPTETKDADGDTRMTGINKVRAKWVSRKELERRRATGACVRCGNTGHRISNCTLLPARRPETGMKPVSTIEDNGTEEFLNETDLEELKE